MSQETNVVLTKISQHNKTSQGSACPNGGRINVTNVNCGMYTIAWGSGKDRQSVTKHCTAGEAEAFKASLK